MRFRLIAAASIAVAMSITTMPSTAEAQSGATPKKRTQIIVEKRSYLDAGTTVKPGSQSYHYYAFGPHMRAPTYGPPGSENMLGGDRWPLLRWYEY